MSGDHFGTDDGPVLVAHPSVGHAERGGITEDWRPADSLMDARSPAPAPDALVSVWFG